MNSHETPPLKFPDHNQNFWQLASIQSASLGLPVILIGSQIAKKYGEGAAILAVIIGNMILWLIGLAMIGMTSKKRSNAIQNVQSYLGSFGGISSAIILIIAFLTWYTLQLDAAVSAIETIYSTYYQKNYITNITIGIILGVAIAITSIKGIKLIKWFCVYSLPFLFIISLLALFTIGSFHTDPFFEWKLSILAIVSVVSLILPGIVNLPTFFRHSKSKADSTLALSVMIVFIMFFQITSIFLRIGSSANLFNVISKSGSNPLIIILGVVFILISLFAINLVNIYFASAGWEAIVPRATGAKEFLIVGLIGTLSFVLIQFNSIEQNLENLTSAFIACLGIVLLIDYLIKTIVKHRPRTLEKIISNSCWFFGCVVSLIVLIREPHSASKSILLGAFASALSFIVVLFVEEMIWSIQKKSDDFSESVDEMRKTIDDSIKKFKK